MIDIGRQVADALPNGRHTVLEDQEHVVAPEVLVPVLKAFFAGWLLVALLIAWITAIA
jgi:hypothetical protein